MRVLSPLALCLLLAAGPALAGSDFCDGGGDGPIDPEPPGGGSGLTATLGSGTDPNTSSCEVDMIMTLAPFDNGDEYWRLRDLPFTSDNLAVLKKRVASWPELPLEFAQIQLAEVDGSAAKAGSPPIKQPPRRGQSTFLEWSFVPGYSEPGGGGQSARLLALTVLDSDAGPVLRADWLVSPRPDWSYADAPALSPKLIDSQSAPLIDPALGAAPLRVTLLHDEDHVRVGLGQPVREWISFALPDAQWQPRRLRNGLLRGTALSEGMGLRVKWPTLPRGWFYLDSDQNAPSPATPSTQR